MTSKWEVFHVRQCRHAKPLPKNKFIVIAYTDPSPHGFFVNSRINDYIAKRSRLLPCEAKILAEDHVFLSRDSYVDCRDIFPFQEHELVDSRGLLSPVAQTAVLAAVAACTVLPRVHKARIQV